MGTDIKKLCEPIQATSESGSVLPISELIINKPSKEEKVEWETLRLLNLPNYHCRGKAFNKDFGIVLIPGF